MPAADPLRSASFARTIAVPALFFLICFIVLTWPAAMRFSTHFFADEGDGMQNVWNLWWMNRATVVLHENPWHTTYLRYPYGTTLVGHTLNPFNGYVAIALLRVTTLVTAHNVLVTFSFVAGGVTAFLLAYYLTSAYWPSIVAGYIFTFSSFHFAHAEGHLQLVSLEWIPLFVLLWMRLVATPSVGLGVGAAATLFLVILCDYYYFLYCVIAALIILGWVCIRHGVAAFADVTRMRALAAFAIATLATSGVLAGTLVWSNIHDPLTRTHPPTEYSLDLLGPFVYGGHWRFGALTERYWRRLPSDIHETSVHLGFAVVALVVYVWTRRDRFASAPVRLFVFLMAFFGVAALGPSLQIAGKQIFGEHSMLPYALLQVIFPPLAMSGVPIRMMVMVTLAAAMICAFGLARLLAGSANQRRCAIVTVVLIVVETMPKPIPTTRPEIPEYVGILEELPDGGVLDTVSRPSVALFYQTVHQKPMALGYPPARLPRSVAIKDSALEQIIAARRFDRLWPDYRVKYLVAEDRDGKLAAWPGARPIWTDGTVALIDVSQLEK